MQKIIALALCALCLTTHADVTLTYELFEKGATEIRYFNTVQVKNGVATMTTSGFAGNRILLPRDNTIVLLHSLEKMYSTLPLEMEEPAAQKVPEDAATGRVAGVSCKKLAVYMNGELVGERCVADAQDLGIDAADLATLQKYMVAMQIVGEDPNVFKISPMLADGSIAIAHEVAFETFTRSMRLKKIDRATLSADAFKIPADYKRLAADNPDGIDYMAETGDSEAKFAAATQYMTGDVVERDIEKSLKWYRLAAEQNHVGAQRELGLLYMGTNDVAADYAIARRWLSRAAAAGDGRAQFGMALLYRHGKGVDKNLKQSTEWLLKSAEAGIVRAQFDAAYQMEKGLGTDVDMAAAAHWYAKAARGGSDLAMMWLATAFETGENGISKDINKAIDYYEQAVEAGVPDAAFALTSIYTGKDDVPQDSAKMIYYAKLSALLAAESDEASDRADEAMFEEMYEYARDIASPAQRQEADDLIRKWKWRPQ